MSDLAEGRAAAYAAALHRIAELIERGELPVPTVATSMSWYPNGDDAREQAVKIARTLGGDWRADPHGGGDYLHSSADLTPWAQYGGALRAHMAVPHSRPEAPTPPVEAFAAELRAAVDDACRALIAAQGGPITRAALEAAGIVEGKSNAGCSCGARFSIDELEDHIAVCPLPDPSDDE